MRLYHGTGTRFINDILMYGILPRSATGNPGNWEGGWQSKRDFVYLSEVYPVYYASSAASDNESMVILEIDPNELDELYPDDEFIARMLHRSDPSRSVESILADVDPANYPDYWERCLDFTGTVACKKISPSAIKQHRELAWDARLWSAMGGDAVPGLDNFRFCGPGYQKVIEAFMDHGEEEARKQIEKEQVVKLAQIEAWKDTDD